MRLEASTLGFKREFAVVPHGPDRVELRSGVWNPTSVTVEDEASSGILWRVVRRLDGTASTARIAREEGVPRRTIEAVVDHLLELDVLETGRPDVLDGHLQRFTPFYPADTVALTRRVVVLGEPGLAGPLAELLRDSLAGVDIETPDAGHPAVAQLEDPDSAWLGDGLELERMVERFADWDGALLVWASTMLEPTRLQILNRVALARGISWLHAGVDGPFVLVGPTFVPHRTPCFECLETRVTMNLREAASYQRYKAALADGALTVAPALAPPLAGLVAAHAALEAINFALAGRTFTLGKVLAIYLPTMEFSFNEVLRVPGCPACAPTAERDDRALYFDIATFADA
jgi:bacteriocin biosynthesis cyclodehydratase domain-containing protein